MSYALVAIVALLASGLTFFSGFGLGTLLLPAFAVFFPIEVAVAATAVVHLANNLFKLGLIGRHAVGRVVLRFGVPALLAAAAGGVLLAGLAGLEPLARYQLLGNEHRIAAVKLVVAALILAFALLEAAPRLEERTGIGRWPLPLGGALSGFFGGLSGHQGALRSAVLVRLGLGKEQFIATGVACAVLIDVARLAVYSGTMAGHVREAVGGAGAWLLLTATAAAFVGAVLGRRLLQKVTMRLIRVVVAVLLLLSGLALGTGLI